MLRSNGDDKQTLVFLCIDESVHALRALEWFRDHFYRKNHIVGIVHIHPPLPQLWRSMDNNLNLGVGDTEQGEAVLQQQKSSSLIQDFLNRCVTYGMKVRLFSHEKNESVGRTICNLIKEHQPSCLVMGQRGLGTVKRTIYGSVSDYVLHHAHIPVVIVPPPQTRKLSQ